MHALVDQERGLMKDLPEELEKHGIRVTYTAHWQNGQVERQNARFRVMFDRVKAHVLMEDKETDWVIASVTEAKNHLRRRHGYTHQHNGYLESIPGWEWVWPMEKMRQLRDSR